MLAAVARGLALFWGGFSLLNFVVGCYRPDFDMNQWWIDTRPLPRGLSQPLMALMGLSLVAYAVGFRRYVRLITLIMSSLLLLISLANVIAYYRFLHSGQVYAGAPLPFSLFVAAAVVIILAALVWTPQVPLRRREKALLAFVFLASMVSFPLAQVYCFGATDYRRPADVIVVFGAHVYPDGHPSLALRDRVRTACELYHAGLAPRVIFSGGPETSASHEVDAMRRVALASGVPEGAILVDRNGLSTHDTVVNTTRLFTQLHVQRVLAVSHFYHLPRIKMSYRRAGWEVYTVPVTDPMQPANEFPYMLLRETAAMWAYYLTGR